MTKSTAPRAFAGLILIVAVVAAFVLLPIKQYLADFVDWVQGLGWCSDSSTPSPASRFPARS